MQLFISIKLVHNNMRFVMVLHKKHTNHVAFVYYYYTF